jgi:L-fucose isomerase-like protein
MSLELAKPRIGFVPAKRGTFNANLAVAMRQETIAALEAAGVEVVVPSTEDTPFGCVENRREAELCAELFRRRQVEGILLGAMNFGDEQSAAWVVRQAKLDVPVFIFGCQEDGPLTRQMPRRDAFCGLLSIGEALRQIDARYSVGQRPICLPGDRSFQEDVQWFVRVCRVVNGVRRARYGQIGARPDAFWTCRFDEKQLQRLGPTTVVLDLSEAIAGARAIGDSESEVQQLLLSTQHYADTSTVPQASLLRSVKLELFLRRWQQAQGLDALAIQCWTSLEQNYGTCSCTAMSRLGDEGIPCACEADILGALSMHACLLASGTPAALADWNNLHHEDQDLANIWHCGVFPASFARAKPRITQHEIMVASGGVPREQAMGVVELVAQANPLTLCRVTQDADGAWKALVAHGRFEDQPAETFGGYGWCRIEHLQRLYRDVLLRHFPHHVAITQSHVGNALWEALGNYLGMQVFHATQETPGLYTSALPF